MYINKKLMFFTHLIFSNFYSLFCFLNYRYSRNFIHLENKPYLNQNMHIIFSQKHVCAHTKAHKTVNFGRQELKPRKNPVLLQNSTTYRIFNIGSVVPEITNY